MQSVDSILHAKWIITGEFNRDILDNYSIIIHNGLIKDILHTPLAKKTYSSTNTTEYRDHVLMPGFINAHTHIGMSFFRGLGSDLRLMDWLQHYMFPSERKWLSHDFVHDASLFGMAEMIRSGTTCFNDMYFYPHATALAVERAGLRAFIGMHVPELPTNPTDESFTNGLAFYEEYKNHPLISITFAPHAPYTVSDNAFININKAAERLDVKINLHLHETMDEINQSMATFNKRPIKRLYDLGFLSSRVIAIHAVHLNQEDLDIINQTKLSIVHCPESNMKLASGICPVKQLQAMGISVALGTDSVGSNNDLDMISEMRSATFLSKISTLDSLSLKADETIQLATINGAKALGIDAFVGTLTTGKAADLIAINLNKLETLPVYNPAVQIVYSSNRDQVTDVWVAGKQLLKNRILLTLDEEELKESARRWGDKIKG